MHVTTTGVYSGQYWTVTPWGDGSFQLTNDYTGSSIHLDVYADTKEAMLDGDDHSGQHWRLTKIGPVATTVHVPELTPVAANTCPTGRKCHGRRTATHWPWKCFRNISQAILWKARSRHRHPSRSQLAPNARKSQTSQFPDQCRAPSLHQCSHSTLFQIRNRLLKLQPRPGCPAEEMRGFGVFRFRNGGSWHGYRHSWRRGPLRSHVRRVELPRAPHYGYAQDRPHPRPAGYLPDGGRFGGLRQLEGWQLGHHVGHVRLAIVYRVASA